MRAAITLTQTTMPACVKKLFKKAEPFIQAAYEKYKKCKDKKCRHDEVEHVCAEGHKMADKMGCKEAHAEIKK